MELIHSAEALAGKLSNCRLGGKQIGFVPTMGALHAGHLSLIEIAKKKSDVVVVSIFVNPLQFLAGEDFDKYPRTLGSDANLLSEAGVDFLFAPGADEVYPTDEPVRQIKAGKVGEQYEGAIRPGHFDGMLTVVSRLLDLVEPDVVCFGEKDAQQVALVRQMLMEQVAMGVRAPVELVVGPTIRDENGLALSSRNKFLQVEEYETALSLSKALNAGLRGESRSDILRLAKAQISPKARLDYLELVDEASFEPTELGPTPARLIVAAKVGEVRLLDNILIDGKS